MATRKQKPKVSIGMPVYNGEPFIHEALDSLLKQTFTEFELIISDNASTDDTERICREYVAKDQRIRYVRQPENFGAIANFRFVLDEAIGKYFMWAAADDVWLPQFIHTCFQLLNVNLDANFAITAYEVRSRVSRIIKMKFKDPLSCIQIKNKKDRVLAYSKLSLLTHKDNLVYAIWKKEFLKTVVDDIRTSDIGKVLIAGPMNEYALALHRGAYSPAVQFYKYYLRLPPGHVLDKVRVLVKAVSKVKRKIRQSMACDNSEHLSNLSKVMNIAGFDSSFIDKVIVLNKTHMGIKIK